MQFYYVNLLRSRGVYVERKHFFGRSQALANCLNADKFVPLNEHHQSKNKKGTAISTEESAEDKNHINTVLLVNQSETKNKNRNEKADEANKEISFEEKDGIINVTVPKSNKDNRGHERKDKHTNYALGINSLIKSYQGRDRENFIGRWDEDLSSEIHVYNTLSNICGLDDREKADAVPVMLKEDVLTFFSSFYKVDMIFDQVVGKLSAWYTSDEQQGRVLRMWQGMRLSEEMRNHPEKSEMEAFRTFSYRLTTLQKKLSAHYQHDDFLRAQLIIATDINHIQQSLKERIPKNAQEAVNRIATFLSHQPKTAGAFFNDTKEPESGAMYSLGQKYGGDARKHHN